MPNDTQKLLKWKEEIKEKETAESELKGRITELESRLKKESGCSSLKEAEEKLDQMAEEKAHKQGLLTKGVSDLEENHEWD